MLRFTLPLLLSHLSHVAKTIYHNKNKKLEKLRLQEKLLIAEIHTATGHLTSLTCCYERKKKRKIYIFDISLYKKNELCAGYICQKILCRDRESVKVFGMITDDFFDASERCVLAGTLIFHAIYQIMCFGKKIW